MRAFGKQIVVGLVVGMRANPKITGKVFRIYPFDDKPNVMVRWDHTGALKTHSINELRI